MRIFNCLFNFIFFVLFSRIIIRWLFFCLKRLLNECWKVLFFYLWLLKCLDIKRIVFFDLLILLVIVFVIVLFIGKFL